jgi:hypothetical protein
MDIKRINFLQELCDFCNNLKQALDNNKSEFTLTFKPKMELDKLIHTIGFSAKEYYSSYVVYMQ